MDRAANNQLEHELGLKAKHKWTSIVQYEWIQYMHSTTQYTQTRVEYKIFKDGMSKFHKGRLNDAQQCTRSTKQFKTASFFSFNKPISYKTQVKIHYSYTWKYFKSKAKLDCNVKPKIIW